MEEVKNETEADEAEERMEKSLEEVKKEYETEADIKFEPTPSVEVFQISREIVKSSLPKV